MKMMTVWEDCADDFNVRIFIMTGFCAKDVSMFYD